MSLELRVTGKESVGSLQKVVEIVGFVKRLSVRVSFLRRQKSTVNNSWIPHRASTPLSNRAE